MAYSPYAHSTATSGHVGLVRLGTGVSGQADGTLVTTSVPNGVTTGSSPSLASVTVTNNTVASSTNSGALQVAGGVGIGGKLYAGGNIYSAGNRVVTVTDPITYAVTPYIDVWLNQDVTNGTPAIGKFTTNNATASSITTLKFHYTSASVIDFTTLLSSYNARVGTLILQVNPNSPDFHLFKITSTSVSGSVITFTVSYISSLGSPASNLTNYSCGLSITLDGITSIGGMTVLTSGSGNWTIPAGVTRFKVTAVGGGGGASASYTIQSAGGGGGGGTAIKYYSGQTPGSTIAYSVGAGGSAGAFVTGTGQDGTSGTSSTFGTLVGGAGGAGGPGSTSSYLGGTGGSATGGDINIPGQGGGGGSSVTNSPGGNGGSSLLGWGGFGTTNAGNGYAGSGYGSGGGGGSATGAGGTPQRVGFAGAPGVIMIEY